MYRIRVDFADFLQRFPDVKTTGRKRNIMYKVVFA